MTDNKVKSILAQAKGLAQRYRTLTGKPLGITGEVAEFEAARLQTLRNPTRTWRKLSSPVSRFSSLGTPIGAG